MFVHLALFPALIFSEIVFDLKKSNLEIFQIGRTQGSRFETSKMEQLCPSIAGHPQGTVITNILEGAYSLVETAYENGEFVARNTHRVWTYIIRPHPRARETIGRDGSA